MIKSWQQGTTMVAYRLYDSGEVPLSRAQEHDEAVRLLCELLGRPVTVEHGPNGVPRLKELGGSVSISHCKAGVAVAFDAERTVGVDIETLRPQLERVKTRFLSPRQLADVATLHQLLDAWTVKEALYKALLTPGIALADIDMHDPRYEITTLHPRDDVALTLAVEKL